MRTAIMTGAFYIGDAIGSPDYSERVVGILATLLIVFVVMDLVDFFRSK